MYKYKKLFTSESVTEGHPDKICDQISDSILDEILKRDKNARVACETTVSTGLVLVAGEISTTSYVDIQAIVRKVLKDIGYDRGKFGFDSENVSVLVSIDPQSNDISQGVTEGEGDFKDLGAGDQGIMFGYATNENEEYMPTAIVLAHKLSKQLSKVRKDNIIKYLRPDGKTQVTLEYDESDNIKRAEAIVVSTQHDDKVDMETLRKDIRKEVIDKIIDKSLIDKDTKIFINPTGRFVVGGPKGDVGLTGRKIIVDTYGGYSRHGGGAFSGKDATKVDRSGAYAARYVAKNIVAAGLCDKIELQLSYAIGVSTPTSIMIDTFKTNKIEESKILEIIDKVFDLTPKGIITKLKLTEPVFAQTAKYGHFGRNDLDLTWEKLDKVDEIKKHLK